MNTVLHGLYSLPAEHVINECFNRHMNLSKFHLLHGCNNTCHAGGGMHTSWAIVHWTCVRDVRPGIVYHIWGPMANSVDLRLQKVLC